MGEGKKTNLIGSILFLLPGIHLLFVLFNLQAFFSHWREKAKAGVADKGWEDAPRIDGSPVVVATVRHYPYMYQDVLGQGE